MSNFNRYTERYESDIKIRKNEFIIDTLKNKLFFNKLYELNKDIIKEYVVEYIEDGIEYIKYKIYIDYSEDLNNILDSVDNNINNKEYFIKEEDSENIVYLLFFIKTTYDEKDNTIFVENIHNIQTNNIIDNLQNNTEDNHIFYFREFKLSLNFSQDKWIEGKKTLQFCDNIKNLNKMKEKLFINKINIIFQNFEKYYKYI